MGTRSSEFDAELPVRFAERLERWRTAAGLTQDELAFMASTSGTNIRRYESGTTVPGSDIMSRLAEVLGRPMDDFTSRRDPPEHPANPQSAVFFKVRRPQDMSDEEWAAYEPRAKRAAEESKAKIDAMRADVIAEKAGRRGKGR